MKCSDTGTCGGFPNKAVASGSIRYGRTAEMMEEFEDDEAPPAEELIPCKICGRSFSPKVLKKHTSICQKAAAKKRKVFDSSRQRAEGTDIPVVKPIKPKSNSATTTVKPEPPKKLSNWRRKHEDFIATIRAAKGITQVIKEGGPLPPPPPPSYDPDYIKCPYCKRRFSENAADRHMKFCKEQASRMPNKGKLGDPKKPAPRTPLKSPAAVMKTSSPAVSTVPSPSSRLPQRSGSGQSTGIPSIKSPAGSVRSIPSGLASPPSGVGRARPVGSGYGSVRNTQSGVGLNKKKIYNANNRNDPSGGNEVDNGGVKTKVCHECGTKYPVESAKFCCECGMRRMGI